MRTPRPVQATHGTTLLWYAGFPVLPPPPVLSAPPPRGVPGTRHLKQGRLQGRGTLYHRSSRVARTGTRVPTTRATNRTTGSAAPPRREKVGRPAADAALDRLRS